MFTQVYTIFPEIRFLQAEGQWTLYASTGIFCSDDPSNDTWVTGFDFWPWASCFISHRGGSKLYRSIQSNLVFYLVQQIDGINIMQNQDTLRWLASANIAFAFLMYGTLALRRIKGLGLAWFDLHAIAIKIVNLSNFRHEWSLFC